MPMSKRSFNAIALPYTRRTGLALLLSDTEGTIIYSAGPGNDTAAELGVSREIEPAEREWRKTAVDGSYRWGDVYFSATPLGFITFSVPVIRDGRLRGALISGFIIFPEMKQDIAADITRCLDALCIRPAGDPGRLRIRSVPRERLKKHAAYLLELAQKYGFSDPTLLGEKREKIAQQTSITSFLEHIKGGKLDVARMIIEKQHEIIQLIRLGDLRGAREILNEYLGSVFLDSGMKFDVLKMRLIELIIIISRSAIESGVNSREILDLNYSYFNELIGVDNIDDLCHRVSKILEDFIVRVSSTAARKKSAEIKKMLDYINGHFTERIAASRIAREAGLSIGRALHLFREETGTSLTHYIKKLRIEYGKYLLLNTGKTIVEIAHDTGFFDQSHFTRNFVLMEKATPKDFRKRYAKLPGGIDGRVPYSGPVFSGKDHS